MKDMSHLNALELRLSHERNYLANAKTDRERELRRVWIKGIEKEIRGEYEHLGIAEPETINISDDDLLAELTAN